MARYKMNYTLYKRGKYWYYRTYDNNGVRTHGISTGKTSKGAAVDFCNQLYLNNQLFVSDQTFSQYAGHFFDDNSSYVKDRLTPLAENSLSNYRKLFNNYLLPRLENVRLSEITYTKLKELRIDMMKTVSGTTASHALSVLKVIMTTAYRDGIIIKNPFEGFVMYEDTTKTHDAFTLSEVRFIYNELKKYSESMGNFCLLMALTGMRISEAWGIMSEDIREENGNYYIHLTRQFNVGKYKPLKTKKCRDIPIIPEILELILFPVFSTAAFYRQFVKAEKQVENAEERNVSVHSLRHFFITSAKAKGVNPLKVEVIAGHKIKGIEGVYTNFKGEDLTDIYEWQKSTLAEFLK